jgi:hypothetical protein
MRDKIKTAATVFAVVAGLLGLLYYGGVRAVAFMAKMHGG